MKERVDLQEFLGGFVAESEQLVATAVAGLLEIEGATARGELRPKTVRELYRALHTMKGLAGMMGVRPIVELSHALESVLRSADQLGGRLEPRAIELGLIVVRAIGERVRALAAHRDVEPASEPLLAELARIEHAGSGSAAATTGFTSDWDSKLSTGERQQLGATFAAGRAVYTLAFAPSDARSARGMTISSVRIKLAAVGEIVKVVPRALPPSDDAPAGLVFELLVISDAAPEALAEIVGTSADHVVPLAAGAPAMSAVLPALGVDDDVSPIQRSFVRVELARLDDLQEQLSGLIVSKFRIDREIAATAAAGADVRRLREVADVLTRQLRELRRGILRARLVRAAEVFEPLSLLVRSLSQPGVKMVRLELDLEDTELDKAVADRLLPAIIHLVRNAVDHAIEPIVERDRLGKPSAGQIRIACREHAGNQVEITVSDDGRGIDRAAIARRAGRAIDSDDALLDVLTSPGFSTLSVATETSGRGLGMDIVRRITAALGGELAVTTELGVGTTFALRVPLTLAIIDVFSFQCGSQAFVVPVAMVEEIFELGEHVQVRGPTATRGQLPVTLCERGGRAVPVIELGAMLRLPDAPGAGKVLVVRRAGDPIAFSVNRMLGRHEVVVRPIEDPLGRGPGVVGATDLGDGRPTLLLDLVELGAAVSGWRKEAS